MEQEVSGPLRLNPVGGMIVEKVSGWFPIFVTVTSWAPVAVLTFCKPKSWPRGRCGRPGHGFIFRINHGDVSGGINDQVHGESSWGPRRW